MGGRPRSDRFEITAPVLAKEEISSDVVAVIVQIPLKLARDLTEPGSFVFLRHPDTPSFYSTPMSVMEADYHRGTITMVIQGVGPKTKPFLRDIEKVAVRGPFFSGLLGYKNIKAVQNGKILVIARGVAQAPALPVVKRLLNQKNQVDVFVDLGSVGRLFIGQQLSQLGLPVREADLATDEGKAEVIKLLREKDYDLAVSLGSNMQHLWLAEQVRALKKTIPLTVTNNREFCCGEGICGSCIYPLTEDEKVKLCKAQLDVDLLFGSREAEGSQAK